MSWSYPENLIIGFNKRNETMNGNLAYITYKIGNKHFKEKSLDSWRDKSIPIKELKNDPKEGFVISKAVSRTSEYSGSGRSLMRVYDPDGFEIEISINNLEYIHRYCDTNRGEFSGKFVYAWLSGDLVLVPVESDLFKEILMRKKESSSKIKTSDLKEGFLYRSKDSDINYTYLGKYDYYRKYMNKECKEFKMLSGDSSKYGNPIISPNYFQTPSKKHIFFNNGDGSFSTNITSKLAELISEESDHYDRGIQAFFDSGYSKPVKEFKMIDIPQNITAADLKDSSLYLELANNYYVSVKMLVSNVHENEKYLITTHSNNLVYFDEELKLLRHSVSNVKPKRFYQSINYNMNKEKIEAIYNNYYDLFSSIKSSFYLNELDIKNSIIDNFKFKNYMKEAKDLFSYNIFDFLGNLNTPYKITEKEDNLFFDHLELEEFVKIINKNNIKKLHIKY